MRISDWSSDVCSSDLHPREQRRHRLGRLLGELGDLAWQRLVLGRRRFLDRCRLRLGQRVQLVDQRLPPRLLLQQQRQRAGFLGGELERLLRCWRLLLRQRGRGGQQQESQQDAKARESEDRKSTRLNY